MQFEEERLYTSRRLRDGDPKLHSVEVSPGECDPLAERSRLGTRSGNVPAPRSAFMSADGVEAHDGQYVKIVALYILGVGVVQGMNYLCYVESVDRLSELQQKALESLPLEFGSSCGSLSGRCSGAICRDGQGREVLSTWPEAVAAACSTYGTAVHVIQHCSNRDVIEVDAGSGKSAWYYNHVDGVLRGMSDTSTSSREECFGDVWSLRAPTCEATPCPGLPTPLH